jgi:hypothetical protein
MFAYKIGGFMKKLLLAGLLSLSSTMYAQTFHPTSGIVLTCFNDVTSDYYDLKIVDIGDEEADIKVISGESSKNYSNSFFGQNSEGSYFIAIENGQSLFNVNFPNNDLAEAYYVDSGDSGGIECALSTGKRN